MTFAQIIGASVVIVGIQCNHIRQLLIFPARPWWKSMINGQTHGLAHLYMGQRIFAAIQRNIRYLWSLIKVVILLKDTDRECDKPLIIPRAPPPPPRQSLDKAAVEGRGGKGRCDHREVTERDTKMNKRGDERIERWRARARLTGTGRRVSQWKREGHLFGELFAVGTRWMFTVASHYSLSPCGLLYSVLGEDMMRKYNSHKLHWHCYYDCYNMK